MTADDLLGGSVRANGRISVYEEAKSRSGAVV